MLIKEVLEFIEATHGKLFSIKFIKRTTGEWREMVCRTGVTSRLSESENKRAPINWKANALVPVFDMKSDAYRSIPIEGIREIKIEGEFVKVTHDPFWFIPEDGKAVCITTGKEGTIKLTPEEKAMVPFTLPSNAYSRVKRAK